MTNGSGSETALPAAGPGAGERNLRPRRARLALCAALFILLSALAPPPAPAAQGGGHTLFGDLKVDESKAGGMKPLSFDIILYSLSGTVLGRQSVPNNGRYRFLGLSNGQYDLVVEVENAEVARVRLQIFSPFRTDFRRDLELEWRSNPAEERRQAAGVVSAEHFYKRTPSNQSRFEKAGEAMTAKKYAEAAALLEKIVAADAQDYQAWTELGTSHLFRDQPAEAERAYLRAAEVKPSYALAYLNLGRLRASRKNYDGAIEVLTKAVALKPPSAEANFLLGESYLQIKKGSKAVPHLEEAARLGRAEAHLRLATLYHAAGAKHLAAAEYEQFLSKQPDYPERERLEKYVKEHKKQ